MKHGSRILFSRICLVAISEGGKSKRKRCWIVAKLSLNPHAPSPSLPHRFGLGSGHIWLDDVVCNSSEFFIHQCSLLPLSLPPLDQAVCSPFDTSGGQFSVNFNSSSRPTQGTTVHVTCNTGKQPREGATSATCATDGTWVPAIPGCAGKCEWELEGNNNYVENQFSFLLFEQAHENEAKKLFC